MTGRCVALREHSTTTDFFHVLLHYPTHEVILHSSPYCAGPNQRFQLQGTLGSYLKQGLDPQEQQLKSGMSITDAMFGREHRSQFGRLFLESGNSTVPTSAGNYADYYRQFAAALAGQQKVPVAIEEAVAVMKILVLADKSSAEQRTLAL